MTLKEILQLEKNNTDILLFKKGIFFCAYERSAMRLTTHIRPLKIITKQINSSPTPFLYCGFPENILPKIKMLCEEKGCLFKTQDRQHINITGVDTTNEDFTQWKRCYLTQNIRTPSIKKRPAAGLAPALEKHYDLMIWFMPKLSGFSKNQRFILADRIGILLLDILGFLLDARYGENRHECLSLADNKLNKLRYFVRAAKDLKYISIRQYDHFSIRITEITRMVGGWRKKETNTKTRGPGSR